MKEVENLKLSYRNLRDEESIGNDFLRPCLKNFKTWRRSSLGFSTSALKTWAGSFTHIIQDVEKIEILCDIGHVSDKDLLKTLEHCATPEEKNKTLFMHSEDILVKALAADMSADDQENFKKEYGWQLLHYLIASEKLVLRFAINTISDEFSNIYHNKAGYFTFPNGARVAHIGSFNESESGHRGNNESVEVFSSYRKEDNERRIRTEQNVDDDWEGNPSVKVHKLSKATLALIKEKAPKRKPAPPSIPKTPPSDEWDCSSTEVNPNIWKHKIEAVNTFLKEKKGILQMATGTGKTKTALEIARILIKRNEVTSLIILTDNEDLLDQWYEEMNDWLENNLIEFQLWRNYSSHKEAPFFERDPKGKILISSRLHNTSLRDILTNLSDEVKQKCLVIHDEVHKFGSKSMQENLSGTHSGFAYKLGLSATPDRAYDEEGNDFVAKEIGKVIFDFPLEKAIADGILCEFNYVPIHFELTDDEKKYKRNLIQKFNSQTESNPYPREDFYRDISAINKLAETKPFYLKKYLENNDWILTNTIIFVMQGSQGDEIIKETYKFNQNFNTYYQGTDPYIIQEFREDKIDYLVSCHKLSEGIDIPKLKNIILVSSDAAKLETIQRIGRCLRIDPENKNKVANVLDFILDFDRMPEVPLDEDNPDRTDWKRFRWLNKISKIKKFKN